MQVYFKELISHYICKIDFDNALTVQKYMYYEN